MSRPDRLFLEDMLFLSTGSYDFVLVLSLLSAPHPPSVCMDSLSLAFIQRFLRPSNWASPSFLSLRYPFSSFLLSLFITLSFQPSSICTLVVDISRF
ncbi:hypothetical protein BDW42DRAFT_34966 [Aspergillus taichungensis]|uniref:Uncharacterized protein n=1 Tax=Aspergillus taichungensis TaxID=482145 RepID=A0A2J5HF77_9EURO|nr:hypothetical protein BDW42DRAFT_34966 [Aspergillus taichungensis]